jgi:hypothetical protein
MSCRPLIAGLLCLGWLAGPVRAETDQQDFSPAERLLLMSRQLDNVKPPSKLNYQFIKRGSLEKPFSDTVGVSVVRTADGKCCKATSEFLSGERQLPLPPVDEAEGNPVILYFLEHDIREMNRLTKGSVNYFRKRIRMALYESASLRDVTVSYQGKSVAGKEILIKPYQDDPNRARFEQFTRKQYVFVLSDAVPGGVATIRSTVPADGAAAPLIEEELDLDGVDATRQSAQL